MPPTVERHKISVTIATVVVCFIAVFQFAFSVGADRQTIEKRTIQNEQKIDQHERQCREDRKDNDAFKKEVGKAIIEIKADVKYLIKKTDDLADKTTLKRAGE